MACTGVFARVVCALKHSTYNFPWTPSLIFTFMKHKKSHSHKKMGTERDCYEGKQRTKLTERQPRIMAILIQLNTQMIELV